MRRATRPRRLKSRRCVFLSTLSLRRATNLSMLYNAVKSYFYPRSPCGERPLTPARMSSRLPISIHALLAESDNSSYGALDGASISIHALLAESDWQAGAMQLPTAPFLSTLSLRRATAAALLLGKNYVKFLSTLSLRRATYSVIFKISPLSNFYPRSPCGERQLTLVQGFLCWTFLSTLSLRRATCHHINKNAAIGFLSTLSLRRAT